MDRVPGPETAARRLPGPAVARPARLVVLAAVLGLVAGLLGLLGSRDGGERAAAGDERRFLPTVLPPGMALVSVHEPGAMALPFTDLLYLGGPDAPDPFAGARALVTTTPARPAEEPPGEPAGTEAVRVHGTPARYSPRAVDGDLAAVRFVEAGWAVHVASPVLGRADLLALAEALRVDGGRAHLDGTVAGVAAVPAAGRATPFLAGDVGVRSAGYADDDGHAVVVAAVPGDAARLVALGWWGGTRTTLAGRPAVVLRGGAPDRPVRVALWQDGAMVVGVSGDLGDDELASVVAGVREVGVAAWDVAAAEIRTGG